jgi:uroporphyrinogen-III synthase
VRVLVTRPEPDARRTTAVLKARGHEVVNAPLLRIEPVEAALGDGPFSAVLVTSANAAVGISGHPRLAELRGLRVFAVGDRSAMAMRELGFGTVKSASGGVEDLVRLVAQQLAVPAQHKPTDAPLLYLAGTERSGDSAGALAGLGLAVRVVAVYRAIAATTLPDAVLNALSGLEGVLHFSRRSAQAYVTAAQKSGVPQLTLKRPIHFCLSAQVAEPLAAAGAAEIRIAKRPTEADLIDLIAAA